MAHISIIGSSAADREVTGDIVVLAVPYQVVQQEPGVLATGTVGGRATTVLLAGDDPDAKAMLVGLVSAAGLRAVDAGGLTGARELEALGFLQLILAAGEKTSWTGGFALAE